MRLSNYFVAPWAFLLAIPLDVRSFGSGEKIEDWIND